MKNTNLHYMLMLLKLWWRKSLPPRDHICRVTWKRIYRHDPIKDGFLAWTLSVVAAALVATLLITLGLDSLGLSTFSQNKGWYIVLIAFVLVALIGGGLFNTALMEVSAFFKDVEKACAALGITSKEFFQTPDSELHTRAYAVIEGATEDFIDSANKPTDVAVEYFAQGNHIHGVFINLGLLDGAPSRPI